jgi:hypothetical protein
MPEDSSAHPTLRRLDDGQIRAEHATLGRFLFALDPENPGTLHGLLFTENETNAERLFHAPNPAAHVKDAFHEAVIHGNAAAVNPACLGTKAAAHYQVEIAPGQTAVFRFRLHDAGLKLDQPFADFGEILGRRRSEADSFYQVVIPYPPESDDYRIMRQAFAGLLWTKQFYYYEVTRWLKGDPTQPPPDLHRQKYGRNWDWPHVFNRDVLSMPDKWEYPWFAAWDLAFHMVEFARIDGAFAKQQLILLLREWYMHPNGQIPAYEFGFSDVNPPVHAGAVWRVYKITGERGARDLPFLESAFQKLLMNFTWWVNRKDSSGRNLFSGGFLGLDNIGVFDRSRSFKDGQFLEQADGTAWMANYCLIMLQIALELAQNNAVYEDIASKFFEHFVAITRAINTLGTSGLWDDEDGFYYDRVSDGDGRGFPLKIRSIVGLLPLIAVGITSSEVVDKLPQFKKRVAWFLKNRPELGIHISQLHEADQQSSTTSMLAVPSRRQLERLLGYMLDENEFLSPYGIRSVSRVHKDHPYIIKWDGADLRVDYTPGDSTTNLFGGNSNWRGPVWFPINHLLIEALDRYHYFFGDGFKIECPTGSGRMMNLHEVALELRRRLASIFRPGPDGTRPYAASLGAYANDPLWRDHLLFNEYFHGDNGRGLGATHQTGWTALIADCLRSLSPDPTRAIRSRAATEDL